MNYEEKRKKLIKMGIVVEVKESPKKRYNTRRGRKKAENIRLRNLAKQRRNAPRLKLGSVKLNARGRKSLSVKRMALSGTHRDICLEEVNNQEEKENKK